MGRHEEPKHRRNLAASKFGGTENLKGFGVHLTRKKLKNAPASARHGNNINSTRRSTSQFNRAVYPTGTAQNASRTQRTLPLGYVNLEKMKMRLKKKIILEKVTGHRRKQTTQAVHSTRTVFRNSTFHAVQSKTQEFSPVGARIVTNTSSCANHGNSQIFANLSKINNTNAHATLYLCEIFTKYAFCAYLETTKSQGQTLYKRANRTREKPMAPSREHITRFGISPCHALCCSNTTSGGTVCNFSLPTVSGKFRQTLSLDDTEDRHSHRRCSLVHVRYRLTTSEQQRDLGQSFQMATVALSRPYIYISSRACHLSTGTTVQYTYLHVIKHKLQLLPAMNFDKILDLEQNYVFYASYHSDWINKLIHFVCVWPILFTAQILLTYLPTPLAVFYVIFDRKAGSFSALLVGFGNLFAAYAKSAFSADLLLKVALAVHVLCWLGQFLGHAIFERRRPALVSNFAQAFLLAPIFVVLEVLMAVFGYEPNPGFHRRVATAVRARRNAEAKRERRAAR
eukprot:jgi/Mesvir1/22834/Mv20094-RA.1